VVDRKVQEKPGCFWLVLFNYLPINKEKSMAYNNYNYQQVPPTPQPVARNSTWAILSLIAGIATWTILPGVTALLAIIFGYVAKKEIRNGNGLVTGGGMATWGLVLGWISLALGLIALCVGLILLITTGAIGAFSLSDLSY
jgi:uncharacterized membrane protein